MLLKSKEIAVTGLLMALGVLLISLGGYVESSTLFFLAAAAFLAGIIERNFSLLTAVFYMAGTVLLGLFFSPQKLYCLTFAAFSIYIIIAQYLEGWLQKGKKLSIMTVWLVKAVSYHVLLIAGGIIVHAIWGLDMIFATRWLQELKQNYLILFIVVVFVVCEIGWICFDRAYLFFIRRYGHYFSLHE